MKVMIVFESMYGNTRHIADAIGSGFDDGDDVRIEFLGSVDPASLDADLLVVGGRTGVHCLTTPTKWRAAVEAVGQDPTLMLKQATYDAPLHEWLYALPNAWAFAAAFDTRLDAPMPPTGHASAMIARSLTQRGYRLITEPQSFFIDHESTLIDGELERARRWGEELSAEMHDADPTADMVLNVRTVTNRNSGAEMATLAADN